MTFSSKTAAVSFSVDARLLLFGVITCRVGVGLCVDPSFAMDRVVYVFILNAAGSARLHSGRQDRKIHNHGEVVGAHIISHPAVVDDNSRRVEHVVER